MCNRVHCTDFMNSSDNWNCEQCTFENFKYLNYCEICAQLRPNQEDQKTNEANAQNNAQNQNDDIKHENNNPIQPIQHNPININAANKNDKTKNNIYIKLMDMGYDSVICAKASLQYPNNLNRAINFVLNNISHLAKDEQFAKQLQKKDKDLATQLQNKLVTMRKMENKHQIAQKS
eukprot:417939_1